jgi:hypothetical protein
MSRTTQAGSSGAVRGPSVPLENPDDPRLGAFADFVAAFDARDLKAGQLATRKLRALGISVCLIAPRDDRRGA